LPERLVGLLAGGDQRVDHLLVVAHDARHLVAERCDDGAGQRREVDDLLRA
jgi:hypothetical protein